MLKTLGLILGILILYPSGVLGEVRRGGWEFGAFTGRELFSNSSGADDDFVLGLRVGYGFWKRFEFEVVLDKIDTNAVVFSEIRNEIESVTGNILWNFWSSPQGIAESYVTVGAGTVDVTIDAPAASTSILGLITDGWIPNVRSPDPPSAGRHTDSDTLLALGAGMRVKVKDRVAFRYEIRARDYEVFNVSTTDLEVSFGFSVILGGQN